MGKWELHCHTSEVSKCANISAAETAELYIKEGYDGIVVTDHFSRATFGGMDNLSWDEKIDHFMSGYEALKAAAGGKIKVLLGMELRTEENANDYLVYGVTEEFLRKYNNSEGTLLQMNVKEFSKIFRENGILLFQAHPFRNGLTVVDPTLLDGLEVYNSNPRHASRNDIAKLWAKKYNLLEISGSDFHEYEDLARGGILTEININTQADLIRAIKEKPELIETLDGFHKK